MEKSHLLFERGVQTQYTIYIQQHCIWRVLSIVLMTVELEMK